MKLLLKLSDIPLCSRVLIYGSGNAGLKFRQVLEQFRSDVSVVGYLDSFASGETGGFPIYRFEGIAPELLRDCQILVVSCFWREIEIELQKQTDSYLVVPSRFYAHEILDILASQTEPANAGLFHQYFDGSEWQQPNSQLPEVLSLFDDETDRRLYRLLTGQARTTLLEAVSDYFYRGEFGRQYFDFLDFSTVRTVIEGGVFDGYDTLEFLQKTNFNAQVHGFEPDIGSYQGGSYIAQLSEYPQVQVRPLGLWNERKELLIDPCPAASQLVAAGGATDSGNLLKVDVVDIDSFVAEQGIDKVDLIKMDIEGAEMEALEGAARVIAEHKPQLAICLYHKKEHLIDIPLYLKKLNPGYRFRLGHYNADHTETVLYALVD